MDPFVEVKPMASSSGSHSGRGDGKATSASGNNKSSSSASSSASHPGHYANAHPDPQAIYPEGKHRPGGSPPPIAEPVRHPAQSPTAAASSSSSTPAPAPASAGSRSTSAAIAATYQKKSETVFLNVYDLHPYNSYLPMFGAYHTAVEIFGREYSFGFHSSDDTGVWSSAPKQVPNAVFREQLEVGNIYLTLNQFNLILTQLKNEWTGNKYHLLKRNCNHFSKALLASLGLKAPSFINRLATAGDMLAGVVPSFFLPKQVSQLIKDGRPDMSPPPGEEQNEMLAAVPSASSRRPSAAGPGVPMLSSDMGGSGRSEGNWRQIAPRPSGSGSTAGSPSALVNEADGMDDEAFAQFLKQTEMEHEKQLRVRALEEETRQQMKKQMQSAAATKKTQADGEHGDIEDEAVIAFQSRMRAAAKQSVANGGSSSAAAAASSHRSSSLVVPPSPMKDKVATDCEGSRTAREHGTHANTRKSPQPPRVGPSSAPATKEARAAQEARVDRAMAEFALPPNVSEEERAQIRAVLQMSMEAGAQ